MYPEPHVFKPERFLKDDGTIDPDVHDPSITGAFGFGRRYVRVLRASHRYVVHPCIDTGYVLDHTWLGR